MIFIRDTACFHCDSMNYESQFIESQWKHAVSPMKMPAVRDSASSLIIRTHHQQSMFCSSVHCRSDIRFDKEKVACSFPISFTISVCAGLSWLKFHLYTLLYLTLQIVVTLFIEQGILFIEQGIYISVFLIRMRNPIT